nr:radical SAM family heme chaperone HemW [Paludibacteraceae bacterium]
MAGIYIHIPFCEARCKYCDFFSTTRLERRDAYVAAVAKEVARRNGYLPSQNIHTVYFGGGTPSMLSVEQIGRILGELRKNYVFDADAEITTEANPSDINEEKLRGWKKLGINRLSIGIQSFQDAQLKQIGRRHNAEQARQAVRMARDAGFENISIDLMYGLPGETLKEWKEDVEEALKLKVEHVSAYCLSYEEGTPLTRALMRKEIEEVDEETENVMYDWLTERLSRAGLERYEVSNFAKKGFESQHNSSYWNGIPYLGLGAGAHSYDGKTRQWNVSDLEQYIRDVEQGETYFEKEVLTKNDLYNEYIMLKIRTREGVNLSMVPRSMQEVCKGVAKSYIENGKLRIENEEGEDHLVATQDGIHILNRIIEDLMKVEN